jgi:hypothetical protein
MSAKQSERSLDITVFVRVKPFAEKQLKSSFIAISDQADAISVTNPAHRSADTKETFNFERVFTGDTSQQEVYEEVRTRLTDPLFAGTSVGVFSFGQEGERTSCRNLSLGEDLHSLREKECGL